MSRGVVPVEGKIGFMSDDPPIVRLEKDLESRIKYFTEEYDIRIAETVGCLEIIKARLLAMLIEGGKGNVE